MHDKYHIYMFRHRKAIFKDSRKAKDKPNTLLQVLIALSSLWCWNVKITEYVKTITYPGILTFCLKTFIYLEILAFYITTFIYPGILTQYITTFIYPGILTFYIKTFIYPGILTF